mgnify:FL=1
MGKILNDVFPDEVFEKILKWADSSMNYPEKADKIDKLMKKNGLKPLDSGTNRVCYTHKDYPKVVFKVGFDPQGILDNLNEFHKSSLSEDFATSYELDEEGLILVQEKCPTIDFDYFQKKETKKKIRRMLERLDEEGFILIDLGLDKHKNYGVDRKGRIRIIDFGYVELKSLGNFSCPHVRYKGDGEKKKYCKGKLRYNNDFTMLECDKCENVFRIDVVLEGYTETKYKDNVKIPKYKPSKELDEFYKNFNKHRDRATLKQFVAISNRTNMKGEEENLNKSVLQKLKRLSGGVSSEEKLYVPEDQEIEKSVPEETPPVRNRPKRPISTYYSTSRGIDVLKKDESLERERKLMELTDAFNLINSDNSEESDKIVRDLFFARFPHVVDALKDVKQKISPEELGDDEEIRDMVSICTENNIQIYRSGTNDNEVHIALQFEEVKKDPWIVMSMGETIVHINLKEHMKNILEVDHDEETELIVTCMNTTPLNDFNGDYEKEYFGSDEDDDE